MSCISLNVLRSTLAFAVAAASIPALAAPPLPTQGPPDQMVVATIGKQKIKAAELIASARDKFDAEQQEYEREVRRLQIQQARAYHDMLQQELDRELDQRALALEAAARGIGTAEVLAELQVPAVTDEEARALYETRKSLVKKSYEELSGQIVQYLQKQHAAAATRSFYDTLRTRHGILALLPPYRAPVLAQGPARGDPNAPVTIVEFGDFQCPYCLQAESTINQVMAHHPQEVRLVFRNLPLTELHPNAGYAAEAAVCAGKQGKFWEMHDAMFANQTALGTDGLMGIARRIGLDSDKFHACVTDPSTMATVQADANDASVLNLNSTPSFFINGRPVDGGNAPAADFEAIISDELQRLAAKRGG